MLLRTFLERFEGSDLRNHNMQLFKNSAGILSKYINERKFVVPFDYYNKKITVKTNIIDNKYNFNWISSLSSEPKKEIKHIEKIITFFNNNSEEGNYVIITDYQFILSKIDTQRNIFINKWHHPGVSYPMPNNKNFNY